MLNAKKPGGVENVSYEKWKWKYPVRPYLASGVALVLVDPVVARLHGESGVAAARRRARRRRRGEGQVLLRRAGEAEVAPARTARYRLTPSGHFTT